MGTKATASARTHPCLRGIFPSSAKQPGLVTKACYFTINNHQLVVLGYPYEITPLQGRQAHVVKYHIPYCEISGRGPPPDDLTGITLGDIYIDISPGKYAAYGRVAEAGGSDSESWQRWYDPQPGLRSDGATALPKHPYCRNRWLWCSDATGINWFTATTVSSIQARAKSTGLVSRDVGKTEAARWREASAIIGSFLQSATPEGFGDKNEGDMLTPPLSPLSFPSESRESSPLIGKRKTRGQGAAEASESRPTAAFVEGERYKAVLRSLTQRLKAEKNEIVEDVRALEEYLASNPSPPLDIPESKEFSAWIEKVLTRGIEGYRHELDPGVREYRDLKAELAVVEAQHSKEESMLEDAQILLGLAIYEHKRLKSQCG
ncbi:hypothetical protein B0H16DRAFT_1566767 [Mycena metata]|uniref:Uncharacterized protein n=1 Tax=Mycena metata TaxID=1033252 RepID=A0AAD7N1R5_9AGAR|nr:hypothetical protein B0H16DRAFT_1566767 [Mycena metata]